LLKIQYNTPPFSVGALKDIVGRCSRQANATPVPAASIARRPACAPPHTTRFDGDAASLTGGRSDRRNASSSASTALSHVVVPVGMSINRISGVSPLSSTHASRSPLMNVAPAFFGMSK
jgi:hypothetical protein